MKFHYHLDFEEAVRAMAFRMNVLRNDAVHANLDFDIDPIHLTDYKVIEILLYAMRLRWLGIELKAAQQGLADLFGI